MYRKEKKIPTIFALFLLFLGIGTAVYLDRSAQTLTISAKTIPQPEEIRFSNITDNSFTISWFTKQPIIGTITVGDGKQKLSYLDDLDSDNIPRPRTTHYFTIKNLKAGISYTVRIINDDKPCNDDKYCPVFIQKTALFLPTVLTLPPSHGTILKVDGKPAEGAVVYLSFEKSSLLSGRVDSSGLWVIPLNNLRTADLLKRPDLSDNDIVELTAELLPGEVATATIDLKSIRQNLTIPNMTIGNSYNFINLISKKGMFAQVADQRVLGIKDQTPKSSSEPTLKPQRFDVIFPKTDSDVTQDNSPGFRGVGIPGSQLIITVNSMTQSGRVTVNNNGSWSWRPPKPLLPGVHNFKIEGIDSQGKPFTLNRKFIVLKSGERVLGESTPSATLTPTSMPTSTPSPYPTTINTPTPTATIPTSIPTDTIIPTRTPPPSGSVNSTLLFLGSSLVLILLGIKFLVFQKFYT